MKYKYLKGSERDFEGAPEWAAYLVSVMEGRYCAWVSHGDDKYQYRIDAAGNVGSKISGTFIKWGWKCGIEIVAERQPITEPSWDGAGLPPVGCECEAMISNPSSVGHAWRKVKVVHIGEPGSKCEALVFDVETTYPSWADEFRPIRSEAEKKREERTLEMLRYMPSSDEIDYGFVCAIYDAIAAGKIPGVKLED